MVLPSFRSDQYIYDPLIQDDNKIGKSKRSQIWWIAVISVALFLLTYFVYLGNDHHNVYYVAEEDWHMPSDIKLRLDDPIWQSSTQPFFHEVVGYNHKELGYGNDVNLDDAPFVRRSMYRHLLHSFHSFSVEHDFHWWLAHGSLLGQRWGEKIMSGDVDVDVQCSLGALHRVKRHQNKLYEERFMLLVNPNYVIRQSRNKSDWKHGQATESNVIDARWLDVLSGYFIDITALSSEQSGDPENDIAPFQGDKVAQIVQDKSPHISNVSLINPQHQCLFEGLDLWCPHGAELLLKDEYEGYDLPHFQTWRFNETIRTFEKITCRQLVSMYQQPTRRNCDSECRQVVSHERTLHYLRGEGEGECTLKVSWFEGFPAKEVQRTYRGTFDAHEEFQSILSMALPPIAL